VITGKHQVVSDIYYRKTYNYNSEWQMKEYNIVEVYWVDAEELGDTGWNNLKSQLRDAKKPCPVMRSVGYEVWRDNDHIALLSTMGKDLGSTLEKIPIGFIKSIIPLQKSPNKPE